MKSLRFRIKTAIGIILIAASLAAMFYWESVGREIVMMAPVLVTARNIEEGDMILPEDLAAVRVPFDSLAEGALRPGEEALLTGKLASAFIPARQQLVASMFRDEGSLFKEGETIFCLESDWIYSRPASLCAGDRLSIYRSDGSLLGCYTAAYIRNGNEQAINFPRRGETMLGRSSDGIIEDIEIICREEDYFAILGSISEHEERLIAGGSYVSGELRRCLVIAVEAAAP